MHPEACEHLAAVRAGALRHFVLVVREEQVVAAGVDVDGFAEMRLGHRRAFDVPTRPAHAPGRIPARQFGWRGLPQNKVARVALVRRDVDARAGDHLVHRAARKLAVVGIAGDREQHVAVGGIGMAAGDEFLDHRDHLRHVFGGMRLDVLADHTESVHVLAIDRRELVGDRRDRYAEFLRGVVDLVVHVGDVAGVDQLRVTAAQQPGQHVEDDRPARIADMHVVVDGGTAQVHRHPGRVGGFEGFQAAVQVVVEAQFHGRKFNKPGRVARVVA